MTDSPFLRYLELRRDQVTDWDRYPFSIPAIRSLERLNLEQSVTIFVGENGAGKSTLIEALALRIGHSGGGGTRNFAGVSHSSESELHEVRYTETEHYAVTRDFLLDPKRATRRLFDALDAKPDGDDPT